jgi:antitoxin ParD1/3/4
MAMPTSVALGDHFEGFVRQQLASGRFNNTSEVVRAGLRLLEDAEQRRVAELDALRADVHAGLASGPRTSADDVFERLDAKYTAQAAERDNRT